MKKTSYVIQERIGKEKWRDCQSRSPFVYIADARINMEWLNEQSANEFRLVHRTTVDKVVK